MTDLAFNPENPREELAGTDDLGATYETVGMLQGLAILPASTYLADEAFPEHKETVGETPWVVLTGNRRLKSALDAGLATVPVLVNTKVKTRAEIEIAALVENIQREPLKPLEELATVERLKKALGTYAAVAKKLGKTEGWVSQRRRLANLVPEVRTALEQGAPGMTVEAARELGKITDPQEQVAAWKEKQQAATERAAQPKKKRGRAAAAEKKKPKPDPAPDASSAPTSQSSGTAGTPGVPSQPTGDDPKPADAAAAARHTACITAIKSTAGDINGVDTARLFLAALQVPPGAVDTAPDLAEEWLTAAEIPVAALHLPGSSEQSETGQGATALALATCELHLAEQDFGDPYIARPYLNWLVQYGAYQPASDIEQRILDHVFTA